MDVKEKLVELQLQADIADNISENTTQHRQFTADFMIANGVTVQELDGCEFCSDAKWISGQVMASHSHNDGIICNQIDGDFDFCPMCGRKLPEPPKEVER